MPILTRMTTPVIAPLRPSDGHKGTFGRVLVIGGSRGLCGAAALAGRAALRGGAGLVTVACPISVQDVVASFEPSYTTWGLMDDGSGRIDSAATVSLQMKCDEVTAVALGPGLGQSEGLRQLVTTLYRTVPVPMVVDADALNLLASSPASLWAEPGGPRVLTPHPGEFARFLGCTPAEVNANREQLAGQFALEKRVVVLLKGAESVITDGVHVALNTTGNSGLATGGSGDVLSGLVAALLAGGMPALEAARLAAHLHGLAADLAVAELSEPGLIASDLPEWIARAWLHL